MAIYEAPTTTERSALLTVSTHHAPRQGLAELHLGYVLRIGVCAASGLLLVEALWHVLEAVAAIISFKLPKIDWEAIRGFTSDASVHGNHNTASANEIDFLASLVLAAIIAFVLEPTVHRFSTAAKRGFFPRHSSFGNFLIVLAFSLLTIGIHDNLHKLMHQGKVAAALDFLEMATIPIVYTAAWNASRKTFRPRWLSIALWLLAFASPFLLYQWRDIIGKDAWDNKDLYFTMIPSAVIGILAWPFSERAENRATDPSAGQVVLSLCGLFIIVTLIFRWFGWELLTYRWIVWDASIYGGWGLGLLLLPDPDASPEHGSGH